MSYFHPIYRNKHTVIPGVGTVHSQSVGSCNYTTGIDHRFLPEGADKEISGHVRFSAYVAESGKLEWRFVSATGPKSRKRDWQAPKLSEDTQVDYLPEVIAEMRRLSETLYERDPTGWFFHAVGAIEMELNEYHRKEQDSEVAIAHLTKCLANPAEPKQHFVSAKECGGEKGYCRSATDEERQARRKLWQERIDHHRNRLSSLHSEEGERIALLKRLRQSLTNWSEARSNSQDKPCPLSFYEAAISAER